VHGTPPLAETRGFSQTETNSVGDVSHAGDNLLVFYVVVILFFLCGSMSKNVSSLFFTRQQHIYPHLHLPLALTCLACGRRLDEFDAPPMHCLRGFSSAFLRQGVIFTHRNFPFPAFLLFLRNPKENPSNHFWEVIIIVSLIIVFSSIFPPRTAPYDHTIPATTIKARAQLPA